MNPLSSEPFLETCSGLMRSISQKIPFKIKLKIRSLGWSRKSYDKFRSKVLFSTNNHGGQTRTALPQDLALSERLILENENYDPYRHQEMILQISEPVVIEPLSGAVIARKRFIIEDALSLPIDQPILLPFFPIALYNYKLSQVVEHVEKAISIRHSWGENNYFHFYNDILPKLALLQTIEIFKEYPIIVSRKLYERPYFQEAISIAGLQNKKWIVQNKSYLQVDQLVVIRAHELTAEGLHRNLRLLKIKKLENPNQRKFFLTRSEHSLRNLSNRKKIVNIAQKLGFETIDCEQLSLQQQINLFANSRIVVGEHGAAFSNIIFRYGNQLDVLEIFPPHHISTCYFVISQALGYQHHILRSQSKSNESYEIKPEVFQEKVEAILANITDG